MTMGSLFTKYRGKALVLAAMAGASVYLFVPFETRSSSQPDMHGKAPQRPTRDNYDIRSDKKAVGKIASLRADAKKTASDVADIRDSMAAAETSLKRRVPGLKLKYSPELQHPEVITTDVKRGRSFIGRPSTDRRANILKSFIHENAELVGARRSDVRGLKVKAEHTNAEKTLSFVELEQEVNGVPVFRGKVKAGFTSLGEIVRVINNLAPGVEKERVSRDFGDPVDAAAAAYENLGETGFDRQLAKSLLRLDGDKVIIGEGENAPLLEKVYFPTEPGVVVPAWRVLIWRPADAYYVIVDAKTGTVLWRKNITEHQTQAARYSVYANPNGWLNIARSPFPISPGPRSPDGSQGAGIPRTSITMVGNEPPYTFNQLGWIPDGGTSTSGNAVHAGLDRDGTQGIDPGGEAVALDRNFTFNYDPYDPNTRTGGDPAPAVQTYPGSEYQQGSVTQLFYVSNWFHDAAYLLGFDEAAGNFQQVNFTGQGLGGDPVRAEAQDLGFGSAFPNEANNANFSTPADGTAGRMQMYMWNRTTPHIDGSLDADIVIHELAHGLSNRLHGNSFGLFNDMSRALGEGWSDFFGLAMLSQPDDPIDGIYTVGAYATFVSVNTPGNSYYGIRRFPTAIMSSVGGPNGRPHNPLTFADIDQTQLNISDGAFTPRNDGTPDQVHRAGEIWCNALWEVRARMIERLGWEVGNTRVMRFVVDGMKLSPLSPTFIDGRDAIIAAGIASGTAEDVADMWAGFTTRGLGAAATIQNTGGISTGGTGTTRVTESFSLPNLIQTSQILVTDESGDNDGYPEPGELVTLTVPITNATGQLATDVNLEVVGGGSANFGAMAGISTDSRQVTYQISEAAPCGGTVPVTFNITSSLGPATFTRNIFVGKPGETASTENFDNVTAPSLPEGWTAEAISGGINFVLSSNTPDTPPNAMFALDPLTVGGGTDLTSPPVSVTSSTATLTFRNNYHTEAGWDGGVLEISIAGDGYKDILAAGGSFIQNGYNSVIGAGRNNPIASRAGWSGNSNGYITTIVQLPASANGRIVHLRWRFGADDNTAATGWFIDTISLSGAGFVKSFACSLPTGENKVSVSGRIITPEGAGLRNATVSLSGPDGVLRRITSSSFGYYQFDDVDTGQSYTISVASKRYRFAVKNLTVTDQLTDIDFVGME